MKLSTFGAEQGLREPLNDTGHFQAAVGCRSTSVLNHLDGKVNEWRLKAIRGSAEVLDKDRERPLVRIVFDSSCVRKIRQLTLVVVNERNYRRRLPISEPEAEMTTHLVAECSNTTLRE